RDRRPVSRARRPLLRERPLRPRARRRRRRRAPRTGGPAPGAPAGSRARAAARGPLHPHAGAGARRGARAGRLRGLRAGVRHDLEGVGVGRARARRAGRGGARGGAAAVRRDRRHRRRARGRLRARGRRRRVRDLGDRRGPRHGGGRARARRVDRRRGAGARVSDLGARALSLAGVLGMLAIAWACSSDRRRTPWRTVAWGLAIQLGLGLLLLKSAAGRGFFAGASAAVTGLTTYTQVGARFVFGPLVDGGFSIALHVLPVIVFVGSLFAVLYHLGVVQLVVRALARGFERTLR